MIHQIQQRLEDLYEAAVNVRADLAEVDLHRTSALYYTLDDACASLSEAIRLARQP
jgi:exonuclease VII large subunit